MHGDFLIETQFMIEAIRFDDLFRFEVKLINKEVFESFPYFLLQIVSKRNGFGLFPDSFEGDVIQITDRNRICIWNVGIRYFDSELLFHFKYNFDYIQTHQFTLFQTREINSIKRS
jgi:hypothetical protein